MEKTVKFNDNNLARKKIRFIDEKKNKPVNKKNLK